MESMDYLYSNHDSCFDLGDGSAGPGASHFSHGDVRFRAALLSELVPRGGRVLNLGCGTLRDGLPIARLGAERGFTMTGVDLGEQLLAKGREKLLAEPEAVQRAVTLHRGDFGTVDVGKGQYDFAFSSTNTFLHFFEQEAQLSALANIRAHLKPGGHFVADVMSAARLLENQNKIGDLYVEHQQRQEIIVRDVSKVYDPVRQVVSARLFYRAYSMAGEKELKRSWVARLDYRVFHPGEWRLLLGQHFKIVEEWGDFDRSPFDAASPYMLFLCRAG